MAWTLSTSVDDFHARAGGFLAASPARNTVLLTVVNRLRARGPHYYGERVPVFGWWCPEPGGPVGGAFLRTPPFGLRLGEMPDRAAAELAAELAGSPAVGPAANGDGPADGAGNGSGPGAVPVDVTEVAGGDHAVAAFSAAWQAATGATASVRTRERLYRLGGPPAPPRPPAGRSRLAGPAERELVIDWLGRFLVEARLTPTDVAALADDRIADRQLHLWEDGGRPVALAGHSAVLAGMSRIGPVYTPPEHRGHGYASGVTAAASAHALGLGATEVLLYTDLSNPTSNSIYRQIGYRPVEDCTVLEFRAAAAAATGAA
ncbi:GNAT family N-acetyltransferase [Kitasatospora sp. NBC_00458]|uniref:GNAT family N-acetyltransferase n=1 Tax=Kitasatospora sp. NBC_00458 TaxID=2903568 RepID=UPI002E19275F